MSPAGHVNPGVGGGLGQTRYDYSGTMWKVGRWREEHDVEGSGAGTFITVVGLQVDGRWDDGVLTGAYLRQWGTRGGWAACGLQFLGDMRWSLTLKLSQTLTNMVGGRVGR